MIAYVFQKYPENFAFKLFTREKVFTVSIFFSVDKKNFTAQ